MYFHDKETALDIIWKHFQLTNEAYERIHCPILNTIGLSGLIKQVQCSPPPNQRSSPLCQPAIVRLLHVLADRASVAPTLSLRHLPPSLSAGPPLSLSHPAPQSRARIIRRTWPPHRPPFNYLSPWNRIRARSRRRPPTQYAGTACPRALYRGSSCPSPPAPAGRAHYTPLSRWRLAQRRLRAKRHSCFCIMRLCGGRRSADWVTEWRLSDGVTAEWRSDGWRVEWKKWRRHVHNWGGGAAELREFDCERAPAVLSNSYKQVE